MLDEPVDERAPVVDKCAVDPDLGMLDAGHERVVHAHVDRDAGEPDKYDFAWYLANPIEERARVARRFAWRAMAEAGSQQACERVDIPAGDAVRDFKGYLFDRSRFIHPGASLLPGCDGIDENECAMTVSVRSTW